MYMFREIKVSRKKKYKEYLVCTVCVFCMVSSLQTRIYVLGWSQNQRFRKSIPTSITKSVMDARLEITGGGGSANLPTKIPSKKIFFAKKMLQPVVPNYNETQKKLEQRSWPFC